MSYFSDHLAWQQRVTHEVRDSAKFFERNYLYADTLKNVGDAYNYHLNYELGKSNPNDIISNKDILAHSQQQFYAPGVAKSTSSKQSSQFRYVAKSKLKGGDNASVRSKSSHMSRRSKATDQPKFERFNEDMTSVKGSVVESKRPRAPKQAPS